MSFGNLGKSAGSAIYGVIAEQASGVQALLLLAAFAVAMSATVFFYRHKHEAAKGRKRPSSYPVGMGPIGTGVYFSGAMRCPKCRSDMEQITIDEMEVDRCLSCHGLWFDDGELTDLATLSVSDFFKRFVTAERR